MNENQFPTTIKADARVDMWANPHEIESSALQQIKDLATLPWINRIAVMPDVHYGKGATVGTVLAMEQAVCPAAVGVDIGCGVIAVKTSLRADQLEDLHELRASIEQAIPVGFNAHEDVVNTKKLSLTKGEKNFWDRFGSLAGHDKVKDVESRVRRQLGTLGGGNHFIEVCTTKDGEVWLTLHSGSRNVGKVLAEHHIGIAKSMDHNQGLVNADTAVFLRNTPEMVAYRNDVEWAQEYAMRSREIMMALFERTLSEHYAKKGLTLTFGERINAHHNYISEETIDGVEVLLTRKGAISARAGQMALIPGSMGTGSYIVRGLGNPASMFSASHGAGRKMSRGAAKRNFTVEDLAAQTNGIECRKDAGVLDEIPGAYKDIHTVMSAQADLVETVAHLQTVLCVKG